MSLEDAAKETSAILFLAVENVAEAPATKEINGRYAVYKNEIKTVIGKDDDGRYVVSGFDIDDTKQEAADAIKAVNAQYGYAPEFLSVGKQVGVAYASLRNKITQQIPAVNETDFSEQNSLEQSTLQKAADLLKNMSFNSENYKDLLSVINKISEMNGMENRLTILQKLRVVILNIDINKSNSHER